MSGTASVPTQFQGAVTATGLQLDNNFSTIVAYLNDPTNRVNYAADTGSTNTIVLTPVPAATGYSAGLTITFKSSITTTGATVANVSGLGNRSVLDQQGRQLTVSAIISGSMYQMADNGTAFYLLSPNAIVASQPALTTLLNGAGTYTVSAGAVRIHVRAAGGGGGGAQAAGSDGSTGGGTRFGTLLAGGGIGGAASGNGGTGGTATGATINIVGSAGSPGSTVGGNGGSSAFGGSGRGSTGGGGLSGAPNSGSGGGGDAGTGGGGSGAYFEHNFTSPAATYTYTVGAGGAAGGGGGGAGATGCIFITTFFA